MDMSGTIQWCILHFLLLVLLWPIMAKSQKLQQYCTFTPQHTMCRTTGIGPTCGQNVPARGVSGADAAVIVASHNRYRARVAQGQEVRGTPGPQPQAADMLEMIWDEELALIAQRHTDQCVFEHECADCRQVERFGVGQNLYMAFESSADLTTSWDSAIDAWYDEVGLMPNSEVSSYKFNPSTGHYTQLVWGSTSLVGCGFTMFEEGGWYKKLYTCNYGPAGNIMFTAMYLTGPPCSSCPQGTSCSVAHPGLCASNTDPKGTRSGQTIAENIAAVKPSSKNQGTGTSRSLVQSQPTVNQLVATLNQLDLSQLTVPGLLNLLTAASAGNAQASIESSSPFDQLLNTIRTQTNTKSSNNLLTSTDVQEANNAQTLSSTNAQAFSNLQSPSRSLLSELPPHPATLALQRQRQKGERRRLQPSEPQQVTAGQLDVERQRVNSTGQSSPPTVVDPRILHVLPAADTLNKFLINVGKDSQIIKTDSLASVRDVLSTLPVGSNPLVYFRSNMGTLRQLSDRGLLAAASADAKTRPRRTRSTKPPAMQLLDSAEVLHPQTSLVEDHSMLHSSQSLTTDSKGGIGSSPVSSKLAAVPVGPAFGSSEETLLSCRNAAAPCPVVTLAGNWTHESAVDHNAIRSVLAPGVGGQVVLGRALPSPASKAACVSLSHRFVGVDEPSPQVAVSVWPLGQMLLQEDLDWVSEPEGHGWQVSRVSFAPVRNPFMVVLTVEPNPADADVEVIVRGFRVTEGLC